MTMDVIHISEAATDFAALMARVRLAQRLLSKTTRALLQSFGSLESLLSACSRNPSVSRVSMAQP